MRKEASKDQASCGSWPPCTSLFLLLAITSYVRVGGWVGGMCRCWCLRGWVCMRMNVYVCVCMCVCVFICLCVCMCKCLSIRTCMYMQIPMCTCTCIPVHEYTQLHSSIHACTYACLYACIVNVFMHVSMYVYMIVQTHDKMKTMEREERKGEERGMGTKSRMNFRVSI